MKQVIVLRGDINISKGKAAAQAAHASLNASLKVMKESEKSFDEWMDNGAKKVVLKGENEEQLFELMSIARAMDVSTYLVRDAGHTEINSGTVTALGVGPDEDEVVDRITGNLKTY
ncbi:peptidyl-tRNA hydrolase Pth2 [Methanonatronarchaeum sp. AMET6-2]|uniref:peptidyl-tRNA hydrolase Pth2 n=1 Tax=Methanonatronarchaeum sp. AMET6-2 TaxID=2933293 RepID=UPI001FF227B5|nr:peptidyl-tRNA hydrolase Pth2 [Methanonatronarchaeum sp. AMET6-2]UOY09454.1 peptidyl-tRNA hydrolase Pth2 [Methanonatronarchaeum sp. AMET6-2]